MNHAAPPTVQVPREEQLMTASAAGGTDKAAGQINSWRQLSRCQKQITNAIKDTDHGAQRFMADPARFLTDAGYGVSTPFARELRSLPHVRSTPRRAYDEVVAGRHPSCQLDLEIDALRLPPSPARGGRVADGGFQLPYELDTAPPPDLPPPLPSLRLDVDRRGEQEWQVDSGEVVHTGGCLCGTYAYSDLELEQTYTITARPAQVTQWVRYRWAVDGVPLEADQGTITALDPDYHTDYRLKDEVLTLTNRRGGEAHSRDVSCTALSDDGLRTSEQTTVDLVGAVRRFSDEYYEKVRRCLTQTAEELRRGARPPPQRERPPLGVDDLIQVIADITQHEVLDPLTIDRVVTTAHLAGIETDTLTAIGIDDRRGQLLPQGVWGTWAAWNLQS